jgi:hypothetical protein
VGGAVGGLRARAPGRARCSGGGLAWRAALGTHIGKVVAPSGRGRRSVHSSRVACAAATAGRGARGAGRGEGCDSALAWASRQIRSALMDLRDRVVAFALDLVSRAQGAGGRIFRGRSGWLVERITERWWHGYCVLVSLTLSSFFRCSLPPRRPRSFGCGRWSTSTTSSAPSTSASGSKQYSYSLIHFLSIE